MKKLVFVFLVPFILSCANEDAQFNEKQSISSIPTKSNSKTIESGFHDLYFSNTYVELENKIEVFEKKMNYNGSSSIFSDSNDVLAWIQLNLSTTSFLGYAQAKTEWYSIDSSAKSLAQENQDFFRLLAVSTPEKIHIEMGQVLFPEDINGEENAALKKCKEDFKACRSQAIKDFGIVPMGGDDFPGWVGKSVFFAHDMMKCRGAYNDCKGSIW